MRTKSEMVAHVKSLMKAKGVTKSALGEALGATGNPQAKVQRANGFLSVKSDKINMADLLVVAQLLEVDAKNLMLRHRQKQNLESGLPEFEINPNQLVPLITSANASAQDVQEWLVYPYDNNAHRKIVGVKMPNEKMIPEIKPGEILFADTRLTGFDLADCLVLFRYDGTLEVGRFKRADNGQVEILFANHKFKPLSCCLDDKQVDVFGVIVSVLKAVA